MQGWDASMQTWKYWLEMEVDTIGMMWMDDDAKVRNDRIWHHRLLSYEEMNVVMKALDVKVSKLLSLAAPNSYWTIPNN